VNTETPDRFFDLAMTKIAGQSSDAELSELEKLMAQEPGLKEEYEQLAQESRLLDELIPMAKATQATEGEFPEWARPNLQLEVQKIFKPDEEKETAQSLFWSKFFYFGGGLALAVFVGMLVLNEPKEDNLPLKYSLGVPRAPMMPQAPIDGVDISVPPMPIGISVPPMPTTEPPDHLLATTVPPNSEQKRIWCQLCQNINIEIAVLDESGKFDVEEEKEPQRFFTLSGLELKSFSDRKIFMDQWLNPRLKNAKGTSASIYYDVTSDELKVIGKINQITFEKSFQVNDFLVRDNPPVDLSGTVGLYLEDLAQNEARYHQFYLWEFKTGDWVLSSPAIGPDGTVYVGSYDKKLYAINGKSGVKIWEFETGSYVTSSPAIGSDGTVYVGSDDNKLYAINGKSGVKLWEFETGGYVRSSPAIGSDGTVYVGSDDNKLYAINPKSGVKLWEFETGGYVYSSPAIGSDGTVYVGSYDKKLYAINGKSGVKLWEFETGDHVSSSPAIGSDGTVYVGSEDKKLYAINGKSGDKLWEFKTGGLVYSSPAIGSDGTVYVGSWDKKLYAIKTDSKGLAKSPWPMRGQNAQHTGRAPAK
jgi:outer membrane protein assembly factor BamB